MQSENTEKERSVKEQAQALYDFFTETLKLHAQLYPDYEQKSIGSYVEQYIEEEIESLKKCLNTAESIIPGSGAQYFQPSIDNLREVILEVKKIENNSFV